MQTRRSLLAAGLAAPILGAWRAPDAARALRQFSEEGRYLPQAAVLRQAIDGKTGAALSGACQMLAQHLALIGDEAGALAAWDMAYPKPRTGPPVDLTSASAANALQAIVEASRGRRIVILNEAHHVSHNRRFAERVTVALAREGFNVFAAEAFDPGKGEAVRGAVTMADGFYVRDPAFAELVRAAKDAGYRLVGYEQREDQDAPETATAAERIAAREEAQADNLIAQALKDPASRVLVYCGFSHIAEMPSPAGATWFAARLKAKTGIDPLTVEQAGGGPASSPERDYPVTAAVLARFEPRRPIVVRDTTGTLVMTPGVSWLTTDLAVFHPRRPGIGGRPSWMSGTGRRRVAVDLSRAPPGADRLLQAVPAAELELAAKAVPADQYPLAPDARRGTLFLRPGRYVVRVETPQGFKRLRDLTV